MRGSLNYLLTIAKKVSFQGSQIQTNLVFVLFSHNFKISPIVNKKIITVITKSLASQISILSQNHCHHKYKFYKKIIFIKNSYYSKNNFIHKIIVITKTLSSENHCHHKYHCHHIYHCHHKIIVIIVYYCHTHLCQICFLP